MKRARLKNPYYSGPLSDHFDGERFFHPGLAPSDKSLSDLLRWQLTAKRARWPRIVPAQSGLRPHVFVDGLRITLIGHSSLLIQAAGTNVLIDPVWSERASPLGWVGPRRHNPPAVTLTDLPPIHAVLLTHDHYDHLDTATLAKLWKAHRPLLLAPLGNDRIVGKAVRGAEVVTGDWWQSFELSPQVHATIVPSYHWSSRNLRDRRMALWGGYVLQTPAGAVYCAGDTAYRDGAIFREIRERCGAPLVAVLPIGAYAPRWFMETQHTNPAEALQIARDCGAATVLGVHWGTFQLTDEPHPEPAACLAAAAGEEQFQQITAMALRPGDTWTAPADRQA